MDIKSLGARIKQVRENRRLTQQQLSEKSGIDQGHISRIERGEKGLAIEKLAAIARALGCSVAELTASVAEPSAEYGQQLEPRAAILANYEAPPGLRDLASDKALADALQITPDEWRRLAAVSLPSHVGKEGYMQLLITLRSIVSSMGQ